ncbi:MAG: hypothetical protein SGJ19_18775 [Planctomycetia bacterium]|nr:hypothetical protein [Planctomycetia bacterium]
MQSRAWAITWRKWLLLVGFATTTGVYSLPAQTAQEVEIARAARQFRRQVYLNYRTDRGEFDHRRAAASQAEQAFRDAGGSDDDAERLRTWLLAGATASEGGAALPPTPEFGSPSKVAEVEPIPSTASDVPFGPEPESTPHFTAEDTSVTTLEVPVATPELESAEPATVFEEGSSTPPVDDFPVVEMPATDEPEIVSDVPAHDDEPVTEVQPDVAEAPVAESTPIEEEPFVDDDAQVNNEEPTVAVEAEPAPIKPEVAPEVADTPAPESTDEPETAAVAGVNLPELAARVSGHNFAVRGLMLDWGQGAHGDVEELSVAVEQAASLGQRYGMLETYLGLIGTAERQRTGDLEKLDRVFTVLADAVAELRERYEASDLPAEKRSAEIVRLNQLSRRLAEAFAVYDAQSEHQL